MKKNTLNKYNFKNLMKDTLIVFAVIMMNIKYCINMSIPEILIESKKDVDTTSKKILKNVI